MKNRTSGLVGWVGRFLAAFGLVIIMSGMASAWNITATSITVPSGKHGRMYFFVMDDSNNSVAGVSQPDGSTSGTIRGVPSGSFTLKAFMDTQGTGFQHANDPALSVPLIVSGNITGAALAFTTPVPVATAAPDPVQHNFNVMPLDSAAFVNFKPDKSNNLPTADSHTVYWSTNPNPGPSEMTGGGSLALTTREPLAVIYNLTNGTGYYFAVRAENSVNQPLSTVVGPIVPAVPAVTASTVNVPVDTTGITKNNPLTPLIVALSDNNNSQFFNYVKVPANIQSVPVTGVAAGLYKIYAILDLSGTGNFDAPVNVSNMNETDRNQRALPIMIDGVSANVAAPTTMLAVKNAAVAVSTVHTRQNGIDSYTLWFSVVQMNKQLVNVSLDSGPQISGAIDMALSSDNGKNGGFGLPLQVPNRPAVGDLYHLTLYYADASSEPRTAAVTAVLDNFPGNTFPVGATGPGSVSPTFGWTNPGNLPGFLTSSLSMNNNGIDFQSMAVLSGAPEGASFPIGQTYSWDRSVQDLDNNQARQSMSFTPGNSGPVISDFNPKSGAAGIPVTITGSGFDSTLANNTVKFNGTTATVTAASATSVTVNAPASSGIITIAVGGVTAGSSAVFNATTTFTGMAKDNANANLSGVSISLVENPAVIAGPTDSSGSYSLPVPARPYFSMMFSKPGYYPTYSALMSITATNSGNWNVFTSGDLSGRSILPPLATGKGVIIGRAQNFTTGTAANLAGAVVTATSLIHPDAPYVVKYTNGSTTAAQDPASFTQTAGDGIFYVVNVDEGDYVTVTASEAGMGFQTKVFNTHGDSVSSQPLRGATPGTPSAAPPGGSYATSQSVTLSTTAPTTDDIIYTTNGSDPTISGSTYSGPISITADMTLKFVTRNKNVNQAFSAVHTEIYSIGASITGQVTDANTTNPVQFANVQLYDQNGNSLSISTSTDSSGNYKFSGLSANTYKVCFYANQSYVSQCWQNTAANPASATPIIVATSASQVTGINAALQTGASITGRVTSNGSTGIQNVSINVFDTSGNWIPGINGAMTDASGNYTLAGIPAGSYKLYFNGQSAGYVSQWYNGVANQSLATTLGVTAGNTYTGYDAQLSQGGSISGRVTNSGAAGIQNVSVQVRDTSGNGIPNINGTSTDGSGNYTLGGLPTGDYKIYFDGSQNGYISQWFNNAPDQSSATILHVLAGGTLPNTNAVLTQGSTIAGTVTTNGVTGIQNISVQLYNSTGTQTLSNTNTDASGGYQFNGLQAGTYKVCFTPGQTNYIAQCYNNLANDPANATGILLTVPGGNGGVNATMTLGGGISGQVTNGSSGIQNISVEVRDTTNGNPIPGVISMWTDASGNYTVRGIPAGGNVKVYFNPNATSYAGQWYNNKTSSANADLVPISAGVTTSPVSALLVPATVPGAPTINSITPGYNNATVNFTAPASDGGRTINNYTVTANPGGFNNSNSGSPITVFGLTNGLQYTISVTAQNNLGSGPAASTLYSLPLPVNNGDDLQTAVNAIAPDGAIWAQAGTSNLTFPPLLITKGVTISGGYSPDYSTVSGYTTIPGRVNIQGSGFKVIFKNVKVMAP